MQMYEKSSFTWLGAPRGMLDRGDRGTNVEMMGNKSTAWIYCPLKSLIRLLCYNFRFPSSTTTSPPQHVEFLLQQLKCGPSGGGLPGGNKCRAECCSCLCNIRMILPRLIFLLQFCSSLTLRYFKYRDVQQLMINYNWAPCRYISVAKDVWQSCC